jgi:hypothetical protein
MSILDRVEQSLAEFHPRNGREFVALGLAKRFHDVGRLPQYLLAAERHSKRDLLEAARTARLRHQLNRTSIADIFFEVLAEREKGGHERT